MGQPRLGQDRAHARGRRLAWTTGPAFVLQTVRPIKATNHAEETYWAAMLDGERALAVEDPRSEHDHRTSPAARSARASSCGSSEDDDFPLRGVGEVLAGSTLELGALRLDVAFFGWHIEGRGAIGRYDILRRA